MITPAYVQRMALYNRWQNRSLYGASDTLSDAQRREVLGAFFGSIHGTLNHLLWGDRTWMARFAGWPRPAPKSIAESPDYYPAWDDLKHQRQETDEAIIAWAGGIAQSDLEGDLTWFSGAVGRDVSRPKSLLITHFFNHQTHHRGQVHCLLTQFGAKPEATDLAFMPGLE